MKLQEVAGVQHNPNLNHYEDGVNCIRRLQTACENAEQAIAEKLEVPAAVRIMLNAVTIKGDLEIILSYPEDQEEDLDEFHLAMKIAKTVLLKHVEKVPEIKIDDVGTTHTKQAVKGVQGPVITLLLFIDVVPPTSSPASWTDGARHGCSLLRGGAL